MLHVKISERVKVYVHPEILFELNAPLLETHKAPTLENLGVKQVFCYLWHNLQALVVCAIELTQIYQLPIHAFESSQGGVSSSRGTVEHPTYFGE